MRLQLLALILAGCTYEPPLVPGDWVPLNTIGGLIVAEGVPEPANTIVFIFDADNPPPPDGTGRPITYGAVSKSEFTEASIGALSASYAVPYLEDTTPDGPYPSGYLVMALMDVDDNFSAPWAIAMSGSTYGDYIGITPAPVFVEGGEFADNVTVVIERMQDIQRPAFTFRGGAERAVISQETGSMSARSVDRTAQNVQVYYLENTPIHTRYKGDFADLSYDLDGPCLTDTGTDSDGAFVDLENCVFSGACRCDPEVVAQTPDLTAFNLHFVDECNNEAVMATHDGLLSTTSAEACGEPDGLLDPYPSEIQAWNELMNIYPRIFIELVWDNNGNTHPALSGNYEYRGRTLPERWVGENFPVAKELNFSAGDPAQLPFGISDKIHVDLDGDGEADSESVLNVNVPVNQLAVTWSPVTRHYHADGKWLDLANGPYDFVDLRCVRDEEGNFPPELPYCEETGEVTIDDIPDGQWRITMLTHTGQSWVVPNEIGRADLALDIGFDKPLESTQPATFDVASQGVWLQVQN